MNGPVTRWGTKLLIGSACVLTACSGASNRAPTGPSGDTRTVAGLDVECPPSLLIGEVAPCIAVALLRPNGDRSVGPMATWSSTAADVVSVDSIGTVTGRSAGTATVSASYEGKNDAALVTVIAVDALRVQAAAEQGSFTPGSRVTMYLQGYYSVASADTGRLRLEISDQSGPLSGTHPQTVPRGGDFFLLSVTFLIPESSTEVCRTAILEVGAVRIAEPSSNASGGRPSVRAPGSG